MSFKVGKLVWVKSGLSHEEEGVVDAVGCELNVSETVARHDGIRVLMEGTNEVVTVAPESLRRRNRKKVVTPAPEDSKPAAKRKKKDSETTRTPAAEKLEATKKTKSASKGKKSLVLDEPASGDEESSKPAPPKKKAKKAAVRVEVVPAVEEDDPDDGLDRPFTVEYSPTGRATCRRCDQAISKGSVRVSHVPLFRGKPGFRIYRHLHCAMFSEEIQSAEDVGGWRRLKPEDKEALAARVEECKIEMEQENQEMQPDELIQISFTGEMRKSPPGLSASLLPFQVEGTSWMYHQEVHVPEIRGGILADEMGMGKTIQTLATILDNRPLLQHSTPGCKHPPSAPDLGKRRAEEELWTNSIAEWEHEMKMNDVPESSWPKKIAKVRAGTLVVCPVIALMQWKSEIEKFTEDGTLTVGIYHGPNRASELPPATFSKCDVILTTYQVLEQDFRKMISPNKVTCPNCGGKFKIDKLKVHLKYFCGEAAQRTEAQSRQRRTADRHDRPRGGGKGRRRGGGMSKKTAPIKDAKEEKKAPMTDIRASLEGSGADSSDSDDKLIVFRKRGPARKVTKGTKQSAAMKRKATPTKCSSDDSPPESDSDDEEVAAKATRQVRRRGRTGTTTRPSRKAASTASKKLSSSLSLSSADDDSSFGGEAAEAPSDETLLSADEPGSSDDSDEEIFLKVVRAKQSKAFKRSQKGGKGKPAKKKFADEPPSDDDSDANDERDPLADVDMSELLEEAMSGAKFSPLHAFCWWRIVLDEAHYIKSRSSQTAAAAFSLTAINRWCLSGTPLQNRVGELYSLIRFLRIEPMAYYFCRQKGCNCKSIHYRMQDGKCKGCDHRPFSHYAHFNKYVLNPIQRDGYTGDGRRAMFILKDEVLDKCLLRRTKETKAADMNLPPRLVTIRPIKLHPVEEDFYNALYMDTKSQFDDYVAEGTMMNNYAHIFDLLTKMRQAVDHPYLIIHSKKNAEKRRAAGAVVVANDGDVECGICGELPTDRVLSGCCSGGFCRLCVVEFLTGAGSGGTSCPSCRSPFTVDLNQASVEVAPEAKAATESMPLLENMSHVQSTSILRRLDLAEFATSSKIEVLVQELIEMRRQRPGSKALVFSQFVNMLDLIRWRIHSDPYLSEMGLGVRILHGGMDVKSRGQALKDFREDPSVRILLMSLKAGGVALNLTVASEVFLVDNWWNPAAEMQAIDRTHRLGQHRPIRATRFIAEGTVEERVLQLQEKKRLVFDGTVGRDAGSLAQLQADDMKALFA